MQVAISSWERRFAQLTETEPGARTFVDTRLEEVLMTHGDMSQVFGPGRADPNGVTTLRMDNELEALLALRYGHMQNIAEWRTLLGESTDTLLATISRAQR